MPYLLDVCCTVLKLATLQTTPYRQHILHHKGDVLTLRAAVVNMYVEESENLPIFYQLI
jgi:hypothetical protein